MPNTTQPEGVPLDVWLFTHEAPATNADLRRRMAARLIDSYSSPGGVVVDLDPGRGEVLAAATEAGRSAAVMLGHSLCEGRAGPAVLEALQASAELVVVLPPACRLAPPRPHSLSATAVAVLCRRSAALLRPGGFLVLGVVASRCSRNRDPLGEAVHVGAPVGLSYFQQLVAVVASGSDADGAQPDAGPAEATTSAPSGSGTVTTTRPSAPVGGEHSLAHIDLLVLARRGQ